MKRLLVIVMCFLSIHQMYGQELSKDLVRAEIVSDTLRGSQESSIIIFEALDGRRRIINDQAIDTLSGEVVLTQDSLVMYCDRAILIDQQDAKAYGNVVIVHGDSVFIFADSMIYDGVTKVAELFGEVILEEGQRKLYTDRLLYDVNQKVANYTTGGTVIDQIDTLVSREGYYYQEDKEIYLRGNITYTDTVKQLQTDSILYLYDRDQLDILGPTILQQDNVAIYCESGLYKPRADIGVLSDNIQVTSGTQQITSSILHINGPQGLYTFMIDPEMRDEDKYAKGDTIIYNRILRTVRIKDDVQYKTKDEVVDTEEILYDELTKEYETIGRTVVNSGSTQISASKFQSLGHDRGTLLSGSVTIVDTENAITVRSEQAVAQDGISTLYGEDARLRPLMTTILEGGDTLLLRADTLISIDQEVEVDSTVEMEKRFLAKQGVELMWGTTTGRCGIFDFDQQDSIITLVGDPVVWSDSIQLTADTIRIYLEQGSVDTIRLIKRAMILSPDPNGQLNQIKGREMINRIKDRELISSLVEGNGELLYLVLDKKEYKGVNSTKSDRMIFTFEEDQISRIDMDGQPESNMLPYVKGMDVSQYQLDGFNWRIDERPVEDAFVYQAKEGTTVQQKSTDKKPTLGTTTIK